MQLKGETKMKTFNDKVVRKILVKENAFISEILDRLPIKRTIIDEFSDNEEEGESGDENKEIVEKVDHKTTRAKSIEELQNRLKVLHPKKKLNYKEKLQKKSLKNKIKKKMKKEDYSLKKKLLQTQKINKIKTDTTEDGFEEKKFKHAKPVFNSEGKMVFSKFDFSEMGVKNRSPKKKVEKDPKKILENIKKQKETINKLVESGENEKVIEIREKTAWKTALAKADGQKVKDDPELLKKTLKKQDQRVKNSKKKWEARTENVKKAMEERQRKRTDNIDKKKKEKKVKKLKKFVKKGKIIPGF